MSQASLKKYWVTESLRHWDIFVVASHLAKAQRTQRIIVSPFQGLFIWWCLPRVYTRGYIMSHLRSLILKSKKITVERKTGARTSPFSQRRWIRWWWGHHRSRAKRQHLNVRWERERPRSHKEGE